jgi:hypothetical protein
MAQPKPGAQISTNAFLQAVAIIFFLLIEAGLLRRLVPTWV